MHYFYLKFFSMRMLLVTVVLFLAGTPLISQSVAEDALLLATFGNMNQEEFSSSASHAHFFAVPRRGIDKLFIRVFDPDCGGAYDRPAGLWETNTIFEVYGGEGCISEPDARQSWPSGNYKSGNILSKALFACESEVDGTWVSFGPFTPAMGEKLTEYPDYVFFKLVVEGRTGNDGNLYNLFISSDSGKNSSIPNSRIFEYRSTKLMGDSIIVVIPELEILTDKEVHLPVKLEPLKGEPDISIIAVPLED
jgi:hypothetical protein